MLSPIPKISIQTQTQTGHQKTLDVTPNPAGFYKVSGSRGSHYGGVESKNAFESRPLSRGDTGVVPKRSRGGEDEDARKAEHFSYRNNDHFFAPPI